jgi:Ca-activated chloride channel homolog
MTCPTNDTLEQLALGFLEPEADVRGHLKACPTCAKRMAALGDDHAALATAAKDVAVPKVLKPVRRTFAWKPLAAAAVALLGVGIYQLSSIQGAPPQRAVRERRPYAVEAPLVYAPDAPAVPAPAPIPRVPPRAAPTMEQMYKAEREQRRDFSVVSKLKAPEEAAIKALKSVPTEPPKPELRPQEGPAVMIFKDAGFNPTVDTAKETQSTFGLDVDTASYTLARSYLQRGLLPPAEAVRVEEFVNYFRTPDPAPTDAGFLIRLEAAPSPFVKGRHLLRIGLRSREVPEAQRKDAVLTFVIDVSGSMNQENRLGLVKRSLRHLVDRLRPTDRVALVVYGSSAHEILPHTPLSEKATVQNAIDALHSEGSTNVEDGLRYAYKRASIGFEKARTNRVILCSDGVANNGVTDPDVLLAEVKKHAGDGIYLTTIGFGMGNFNDHLMERLADGGNGNYAYVDDFTEAKKMFGARLTSMMEVVAADAKVQVEFDPATVAAFRQIGYENRRLANQDFRNDKVDAGEVGAGHQVTALYEVELKPDAPGRLVTVRLRYREPDTKEVVELQESTGRAQVKAAWTEASPGWRLAASVAAFGEVLKGNPAVKGVSLGAVAETVEKAVADLGHPEDAVEFLGLVKKAAALK